MKFVLKPSKYLVTIYLLIHLGAIAILLLLPLAIWIKLLLFTFCVASLTFNLRQQALRLSARSIVNFWQTSSGLWSLQDRQGRILSANLQGDSICTLYFVLLNFRLSRWQRRSVIILPDAIHQDDLRRLRVLLRMRVKTQADLLF